MRIHNYHILDENGDTLCGSPSDPDGYERLGEPDDNTCHACLRVLAQNLAEETLDLANERNRLKKQVEELEGAKIEAVDIIEHMGQMAWGIDLPELVVGSPPIQVPKKYAQQVVERVYKKLKTGRGWLKEARQERDALEDKYESLKKRRGAV